MRLDQGGNLTISSIGMQSKIMRQAKLLNIEQQSFVHTLHLSDCNHQSCANMISVLFIASTRFVLTLLGSSATTLASLLGVSRIIMACSLIVLLS